MRTPYLFFLKDQESSISLFLSLFDRYGVLKNNVVSLWLFFFLCCWCVRFGVISGRGWGCGVGVGWGCGFFFFVYIF